MKIRILRLVIIFMSGVSIAACGSVKDYGVTYKNASEQEIHNLLGFWGERCTLFLPIGTLGGKEFDDPRGGGAKGRREVICDIPERVGGQWVNADGETVENWVSIDTSLIPKLRKPEHYQFIVSVRQDDIRQVEVVIHDYSSNVRQKKKKAMLYCALPEGCLFNSPFTADTFHDCANLTPAQLKRLREESARKKEIMPGWKDELRASLREKGIELKEHEYIDESCPEGSF